MLIKSGAGPNLATDDGQTPVHVAASNGNLASLLLLLDDGGDPMFKSKVGFNFDTSNLQFGNFVKVAINSQIYFRVGIKHQCFNFTLSLFQKGETPLHLACANCHADEVRHLLSFVKTRLGPEMSAQFVNSVNEDGATALHYAGQVSKAQIANRDNQQEDKELVRLLLESQADVNIQTTKVILGTFLVDPILYSYD